MRKLNIARPGRGLGYAGPSVDLEHDEPVLHLGVKSRRPLIRDGNIGAFEVELDKALRTRKENRFVPRGRLRPAPGEWKPYWWLWARKGKKGGSAGKSASAAPPGRQPQNARPHDGRRGKSGSGCRSTGGGARARSAAAYRKGAPRTGGNLHFKRDRRSARRYMRRCTCKITFTNRVRNPVERSSQRCVEYIARADATLNSTRPVWEKAREGAVVYTYTEEGDRRYISTREAAKMLGDKGLFRIILSPEDPDVDLAQYARRFMDESFSKAIGGRGARWVAANHFNTDHPHVHILVSRIPDRRMEKAPCHVDEDGLLCYRRSYVTNGTVNRDAGRILTSMLGYRTPKENMEAMNREAGQQRRLPIDDTIAKLLIRSRKSGNYVLKYDVLNSIPSRELARQIKKRANYLSRHSNAVKWWRNRGWFFLSSWQSILDKEELVRDLDTGGRTVREISFDDMGEEKAGAYEGEVVDYSIDPEDPYTVVFSIRDDEGRIHVMKEKVSPDVDIESSRGGRVDVSAERAQEGGLRIANLQRKRTR